MTTLYRPVLIETAEQAEALPIGTVSIGANDTDLDPTMRVEGGWVDGNWQATGPAPHRDMIGATALVPIELREQTHRLHGRKAEVPWGELIQITYPGAGETDESRDWQCTSYSTPWEEA